MVKASDADGINIFDKDDQAAKHLNNIEQCFIAWSSLSKIASGGLEHLKGLGCPFQFHVFFNKAYLVLGHFLFTPGMFLA